ncbi:MAG: ABC transporter ATP-binding protein [ANME-2 cluster archaeon]|nr:ABC transporter ATP-binding protein [ANME-2 cluster archaeon]MDF1532354.1 ABC transporter ATP-binding protein [ANME-2 cluster archaeon]
MIPIEVHNLTKRFGELTAVDNLDLEVKAGEFFGFIGPNGAGKTTTLQMLSGQLPPSSGTAQVLGIDTNTDPIAVKAAIGIVPELEYPPSFLSVEEYLHFVAAVRGLPDDGRVDTWIKFFGLEERRTTLCMSLSKGMKKKTTISAALLHEPRMLFMDEPFLDLDPLIQRKLKDWLIDFVKGGGTVFLSTHILELAEKLCTRVGIIDKGKLVAVGSLNELQSKPSGDNIEKGDPGDSGNIEDLEQIFVRLVSG